MKALHLDLDGAWEHKCIPFEARDVKAWGPWLRFPAPPPSFSSFTPEQNYDRSRSSSSSV